MIIAENIGFTFPKKLLIALCTSTWNRNHGTSLFNSYPGVLRKTEVAVFEEKK
jgi:hypothetical protein